MCSNATFRQKNSWRYSRKRECADVSLSVSLKFVIEKNNRNLVEIFEVNLVKLTKKNVANDWNSKSKT